MRRWHFVSNRSASRFDGTRVALNLAMGASSFPDASVRAYLVGYHDRLEALMERVVATCALDNATLLGDAWRAFEVSLRTHIDAEDRIVIPLLGPKNAREARALSSEHRHLRARMSELRTSVEQGALRAEVARSLMDELRAHNRHETDVLHDHFEAVEPPEAQKTVIEALAKSLVPL